MNKLAKPSPKQLEWADLELGVIIHYCVEIYEPGFGGYKTDAVRTVLNPRKFKPTRLDPEQWVRTAHEMGAKYAVLVANHCTGFSLWQTRVNDYSCASMSWKDGKGDILADFAAACKKYGMRPGIYYSTGCNGYYNINDGAALDHFSDYYKYYVKCVERQVTELWSEYGELFEVWFDGGIIPPEKGGPDLVPLLERFQPDAIAFQGPKEWPHNVRWVGNEDGLAPEDCWSATNNGEAAYDGTFDNETAGVGDPDGKYWWPAETDMPNRDHSASGGGWSWKAGEEEKAFTPEHLLDCYLRSVGRNSNLLLGMAISTDGDFQDVEQFRAFGKLLRDSFGTPLATVGGRGNVYSVYLDKPEKINYVSIREDIAEGHKIRAFELYADGKLIYSGHCVGHKRIISTGGITASNIEFKITESAGTPAVRDINIF